jgi:hypothetical protein
VHFCPWSFVFAALREIRMDKLRQSRQESPTQTDKAQRPVIWLALCRSSNFWLNVGGGAVTTDQGLNAQPQN